jgi:hypothetical protein
MKAIAVTKSDKEPILSWDDVPDVSYTQEEVLVNVKATAVNRADLLQAQSLYPPPQGESKIMGLEMCGRIRISEKSCWKFEREYASRLNSWLLLKFCAVTKIKFSESSTLAFCWWLYRPLNFKRALYY